MRSQFILIAVVIALFSCSNRNATKKAESTASKIVQPLEKSNQNLDTATFGEGCFWCIEPMYTHLNGVVKVTVGYAGGTVKNPTYQEVCTGTTGHAEVAQIIFNPEILDYKTLLKVFFDTHDPTTKNQQGPDVGEQYRSIILYHNKKQKEEATTYKANLELQGTFKAPIVTEIVAFHAFYPAEKYHQDYYEKNPNSPYIQSVSRPRFLQFEKDFDPLLKQNK